MVKSKIFKKSSLRFSFGQGSYLISDFAWPNSVKAVLVQISLKFETVIFNSNSEFCLAGLLKRSMISFCSMPWVPGWPPSPQPSPPPPPHPKRNNYRTNVLYVVCLKKYLKLWDKHLQWGLFFESCMITHHRLLKVNQTLC